VSKKLPGIRLISVELEIGGEATAEAAKPLQQFLARRFARDAESSGIGDMDFNLIAFFEFEGLDHDGRKTDSEAVAPFGDLHHTLLWIYIKRYVYP
jgi:hypothetical protein